MCRCFWIQGELWIPAASHLGWRQLVVVVAFVIIVVIVAIAVSYVISVAIFDQTMFF